MRLAALSCHVPVQRIDAEEIITSAGGRRSEAKVFTRLFGIEQVAVSDPDQSLDQCFAPALRRLAQTQRVEPVDALIYAHGLPIQYATGQSPVAALCRSHALLSSVRFVYEVDQYNCAGLFWALQIAHQLLESQAARCVAIIAGDSLAELPLSHRYVPACTLIGDAFSVLLLDKRGGGAQFREIVLKYRAEFAFGLYGSEPEMRRYYRAHDEMVTDALEAVGFPWNGNEVLLPHNVNQLIWAQFSRKHKIKAERIRLDLISDIGHCYTTDPVLLLHRILSDRATVPASVTLLSTGLGAYTGACRIQFEDTGPLCVL